MSDTITCPSCSNQVAAQAAFCTNCGHRMEPAARAATAPPTDPTPPPAPILPPPASFSPPADTDGDATRVETPGLHDSTQVYTPPGPSTPWQPADQGSPTPTGPPTTAPWSPPESPPAPPWQQPVATPAGGDQPWGAPAVGHGQSAAGGARSPLGGLAAIVGGLATIVGLFLPWLESNQDGTDATSGWNLTSGWSPATGANELTSNDPYIVLGLGIAALVIGFMLMQGAVRPLARIAALVIGVAVIGVLVNDWIQVTDHVSDMSSDIEVKQAFGYFVTIGGGVLTALGAVLPAKK